MTISINNVPEHKLKEQEETEDAVKQFLEKGGKIYQAADNEFTIDLAETSHSYKSNFKVGNAK